MSNRPAIILVMFGTSVEGALPGLRQIQERVEETFPNTPVRIAFTSKIIRKIWHNRAADKHYVAAHPEIPADILHIRGLKEVLLELADEGIASLVVQHVHVAPANEVTNPLEEILRMEPGLSLDNFPLVAFGRPALGYFDSSTYPYGEDIMSVIHSLAPDVEKARTKKAALFYLGHGNRHPGTEGVYREVIAAMRRQYPDIVIVMGMVEGSPAVGETIAELKRYQMGTVIVKPFMLVAGDHVRKELVGKEPCTVQALLEREGMAVHPDTTGLGEINDFAEIFVQHASDAARDAGISLT